MLKYGGGLFLLMDSLTLLQQYNRKENTIISKHNLTLGSLFDGIGGFPYAAVFYGITPLWASDIDPKCEAVTRRHFPNMKQVGDITKLDGRTLPPVDIITFGSPCQDLSMAGKRAGLQGERSSLFNEAIRIIDEMRETTNGKYPTYAIWENVPGAISSTGGADFATVLSAFTKTEIPMPDSGKWANAGMVGLCRGNSKTTDKKIGEPRGLYDNKLTLAWCVYNAQFFGVPQRRRRIFLVASFGGKCSGEILFKPKSLRRYLTAREASGENIAVHVAGSTCNTSTIRDTTGTLRANGGAPKHESDWESLVLDSNITVLNDQGGNSLGIEKSDCSPTLRSQTHGNMPVVTHPAVSGTLTASAAGLNRPDGQGAEADLCVVEPTYCIHATSKGPGEYGIRGTGIKENICHTLTGSDQHAVSAYAIQGMIIGRQESKGPRGLGISENTCYTLTATDKHATCYTGSSFGGFRDGIGTLCASGGSNGGGSESLIVPPPPPYVVRRLTPVECERLQGFPDGWTAYGNDGKEISDNKRYMMLGNSVAVPCVAYIMQGIIEESEDISYEEV